MTKTLEDEHRMLMSTMKGEQKNVYDTIMTRVYANRPSVFFIYGYDRTSKTFIRRALSSAFQSRGEIVLTIASSGIVPCSYVGVALRIRGLVFHLLLINFQHVAHIPRVI